MFNARSLVMKVAALALALVALPGTSLEAQQSGSTRTPPAPPRAPATTAAPSPAPAPRSPRAPRALSDFEYEINQAALEMARASRALAFDGATIAELARASAQMAASSATQVAVPMAVMARDIADQVAAGVAPVARGVAEGIVSNITGEVAAAFGSNAAWSRSRGYRTDAPEAWAQEDPADSLYREARKALASDAYRKAADLFRSIREKHPRSTYAPDAPYWEAFALHRLGGEANLRAAREALALQQKEYPRAATRGDATALGTRIDAILGRNDARVATTLVGRADRAAEDGCPSGGEDERVDALNAVMRMDPEQAMPILKKVLARREPCTQQLRRTAVMLVASRKQPEAASILMNVARSDPDKNVRDQAVLWLADVRTDEATDMLIGLAKSGDDTELRKRAAYALSRSRSPRAVSTLRELSLDARSSEDVRAEALQYYLRTDAGKAEGLTFLKEAYGRAESMMQRRRLLSTVAMRRSDDARAFLVAVALDEREALDVRSAAVSQVLSTVPGSANAGQSASTVSSDQADAVRSLAQVYDRAADVSLRHTALNALASVRNGAGLDKVIEVARNEKNTELRRSAVNVLSRTKDPRAVALLQEIIDR